MKRSFWLRANRQDLNATKVPTALDIAWSAGVYEGEGHVRLCGIKKRGLALAVSQKDPEILYRLRDWFGGSISLPGAVNPCHHWNACGDNARVFLSLVYQYLSERRKLQAQATNCFEFLDGRSPVGLSVDELKTCLLSYYERRSEQTWRGPSKNEIRKANYEARKVADPEYLGRLNKQNEKWRQKQKAKVVAIA